MADLMTDRKPVTKRRKSRLKKSKYFSTYVILSIFLVLGICGTNLSWIRERQFLHLALREQIVRGSIYTIQNNKSRFVFYSFAYRGKDYHGYERSELGTQSGDIVVVYFDPDDPKTSSLTEYRLKSLKEKRILIARGCLSFAWAAFFVFVVWKNESKRKLIRNHSTSQSSCIKQSC
jgi:hypothetical protein